MINREERKKNPLWAESFDPLRTYLQLLRNTQINPHLKAFLAVSLLTITLVKGSRRYMEITTAPSTGGVRMLQGTEVIELVKLKNNTFWGQKGL